MPSLIVVSGKSSGYICQLEAKTILIGREEGCDLQVVDEMVSREHLELRFDEAGDFYEVIDLESANGVFINDHRVSRPTRLRDGDTLLIGESKILFTIRHFGDSDTAMNYFKLRGEAVRNTVISPPSASCDEQAGSAEPAP